ncbi:MAG: VOC family protein [Bacteroidota bacterium]
MKFTGLTPMLWTNDLKQTIDFYQDILGFELDTYNEEWGWCHLHKDAVNIMFTKPNEHVPYNGNPLFTGSFYLYTEEVDALWEALQTKVTASYSIANFPHNMREFAIFDNNGYLLQFGRELKEGKTITEWEDA